VVAHGVKTRRRDQRGQTVDQLQRLESDVGRSISPAVAQLVQQAAVRHLAQPFRRHGRPPGIAAESLQTLPVVPRDGDARVQAEAVGAGEPRGPLRRIAFSRHDRDAVAKTQYALPGARTRRGFALDRGGEQLRQQRIVFKEPVRFIAEARIARTNTRRTAAVNPRSWAKR